MYNSFKSSSNRSTKIWLRSVEQVKQLDTEQQFEELKQGNTVFEFTADWCPDCKVIEPDLPKLENKYKDFNFVSVDRDKFIDICIDNDILGIPSFLVYKMVNLKVAI